MIYGLGRLHVTYEIIVHKLKFYKRLYFKSGFYMMWAVLLSERSDDCLRNICIPLHVAIGSIYTLTIL